MAKKVLSKSKPKKLTRTSTMEKTVNQAADFLKGGKKKRILKTRTMMKTIEEGKSTVSLISKRKQTKKSVKKDAPSAPKAPKTKTDTVPIHLRPTKPAQPSLPAVVPTKKTIFKTGSRDHLPLPAFGVIDICFCIDATGSMTGQLAQAQSTIITIIRKIESKVRTEGISLRFAIVTYRDHPPQESTYVTKYLDFTNEHEAIDYVNKLQAFGGGDEPEAVHDGLMDSCTKLSWVDLPGTPTLRYIFHIADAPPHGKEFETGEQKQGCLCGLTTNQVIHEINIRQIHYRLIKARTNPRVDAMETIFKKQLTNFDSAQIAIAKEMDIRVSDMIIHEIVPVH